MVRRFEAQTVGEKPIAEGLAKAIASSVKTQTFILADISAVKTPQRRTPPQSRVRAIARYCFVCHAPSKGAKGTIPFSLVYERYCRMVTAIKDKTAARIFLNLR